MCFVVFQYLAQVIVWQSTCENTKIPTNIEELEEALQGHQDLIENISQTYAEVILDRQWCMDSVIIMVLPALIGSQQSIIE